MKRWLLRLSSTTLAMIAGCGDKTESTDYSGWTSDYTGWVADDADDDGYDERVDCDDSNAAIHPDAVEVCDDTLDNDCDGLIDATDTDCGGSR